MQPSLPPPPDFIDIPAIERYGRPIGTPQGLASLADMEAGLTAPTSDVYRDPFLVSQLDPGMGQAAKEQMGSTYFQQGHGQGLDEGHSAGYYDARLQQPFGSPLLWNGSFTQRLALPLLARHELLHAAADKIPEYHDDGLSAAIGTPGIGRRFMSVLRPYLGDVWPLLADPSNTMSRTYRLDPSDPAHLWVGLADVALDPARRQMLPPPLRDYFAPLTGEPLSPQQRGVR